MESSGFFGQPDEGPFAALPDPAEAVNRFVKLVLKLFR